MTIRPLLLPALLLFLPAACSGGPRPAPADPGPTAGEPPDTGAPEPLPSPTEGPAVAIDTAETSAGLGVVTPATAAARPPTTEAHLVLALPVGAADGRPGLAELAADALVGAPAGTEGRAALRDRAAAIGGSVRVEVGPTTTLVSVHAPLRHWRTALNDLAEAVRAPATARSWLEEIRRARIAEVLHALREDPARVAVARLVVGDPPDPAAWLQALEDRDALEIVLFHRRWLQPAGARLAVVARDVGIDDAVVAAEEAFAGWRAGEDAGVPRPRPGEGRDAPVGPFWVPGPEPVTVSLACPLPDPAEPRAAELWALQEAFTMNGLGGRLERALLGESWQATGVAGDVRFEARMLRRGNRRYEVLHKKVAGSVVAGLLPTALAARSSFADAPPTTSETGIAAERARLALAQELASTPAWIRLALWQSWGRPRSTPAADHLRRLADLSPAALQATSALLSAAPMPVVVVGGTPPETGFEVLTPLPDDPGAPAGGDPLSAHSHLEAAVAAVGSADRLRRIDGLHAVAEVRDDGPEQQEEWWVRLPDRLRREREVLGSVVETVLSPGGGVERLGSEVRALDGEQMTTAWQELHRHPVLLLRSWVREELRFRLVGVRTAGDREHAVLECLSPRFLRLRVHVDTGSHLVRVVESWDTVEGAPVVRRESWDDYRRVDGIRVPFRRITDIDDGAVRFTTVWSELELSSPSPAELTGN